MDMQKLSKEFHKKIEKVKTVKILIDEEDTEDYTKWFTTKIRPEVWEDIKSRIESNTEKPSPFIKL